MDEIFSSIYSGIAKEYKNSSDISILTGTSGKILFLSYLYNSTQKKEIRKSIEDIIEFTLDLIIDQSLSQINFTYGGGVTGFYWVINHLYQNKILFEDSVMLKDILTRETEYRIAESLQQDFFSSKYDPLYGYVGKGLYFISKPESSFTRQVTKDILGALTNDRVKVDNNKTTWIDIRRKYQEGHSDNERQVLADCGQAHGVTGIISFLCAVITKFKSTSIKKSAIDLLVPAADWLLSKETPQELRGGKFMFPPSINLLDGNRKVNNNGRLGWCYGDNIIALTLYKVSETLNEEKYRKKADEITLNCCGVTVEESGVIGYDKRKIFDPTLCHGSAGIASIYRNIYRYNKSVDILAELNSWTQLTQTYTKTYLKDRLLVSLFEEREAYDFLYGYSGIGLHLISDIYSNPGWESCIMIN